MPLAEPQMVTLRLVVPGAYTPFLDMCMVTPLICWISTSDRPPGPMIAPTMDSGTSISRLTDCWSSAAVISNRAAAAAAAAAAADGPIGLGADAAAAAAAAATPSPYELALDMAVGLPAFCDRIALIDIAPPARPKSNRSLVTVLRRPVPLWWWWWCACTDGGGGGGAGCSIPAVWLISPIILLGLRTLCLQRGKHHLI